MAHTELGLRERHTIEDGNVFLQRFMEHYNAKYSKAPAQPNTLHRALHIEPAKLS
jgi:hypothetical protein